MCNPYISDTVSFWDDIILDTIFSSKYPNIYSFAKEPIISLKSVKERGNIVELFRVPMTRQAHNEMIQLAEDLLELSNNGHEEKDVWTFIWGQTYFVRKIYHHYFKSIQPLVTLNWIWKSKCVPRIIFLLGSF